MTAVPSPAVCGDNGTCHIHTRWCVIVCELEESHKETSCGSLVTVKGTLPRGLNCAIHVHLLVSWGITSFESLFTKNKEKLPEVPGQIIQTLWGFNNWVEAICNLLLNLWDLQEVLGTLPKLNLKCLRKVINWSIKASSKCKYVSEMTSYDIFTPL